LDWRLKCSSLRLWRLRRKSSRLFYRGLIDNWPRRLDLRLRKAGFAWRGCLRPRQSWFVLRFARRYRYRLCYLA
jgi:hypothetical protein